MQPVLTTKKTRGGSYAREAADPVEAITRRGRAAQRSELKFAPLFREGIRGPRGHAGQARLAARCSMRMTRAWRRRPKSTTGSSAVEDE